ncbi:transcriptional regulator PpsR [Rubrivivax gelatinosus]|uniref:Transcriptional regulator PpsR n=1 Tax=Rubrivivax gelatinosus TaxID=28068 RepID=A0ABS1DNY7_RUBGE|nr:transcriptional regulator PpsR [Rubrivivax gelatinosus]MBK1612522.1 transcriptional regulator PpsR [Rubrivivax gelatinosus]MBK1711727.1 transcriptional regulator PpsR [Rubrivivax gelatinosus]
MRPFGAPEKTFGGVNAETAGALLSVANDITLVVDAHGVVRDLACSSDDFAREAGAEWIDKRWIDVVTPESRDKVEALLREAAPDAVGPIRWRHLNFVLSGEREVPLLFVAVRLGGSEGRGGTVLGFGRDLRAVAALQQRLVEAQQAMERDYWKFRHAETRYRHLFQVASEAVLVVDATTQKILEANPAATRLLAEGGTGSLVGLAFPTGVDAHGAEQLNLLLAGVRATGRADEGRAELSDARGEVTVAVSTYRQDLVSHFLVRLSRVQSQVSTEVAPSTGSMLLKLVQSAPDCLVVTDLEGRVISANPAFVELAQLTTEEQVRGETLDRWLGRTGVDLSVMISNLRQRGQVRLFATTLRGEYGAVTDVEISATMVAPGDRPFLGFTIRDVGRRLAGHDARTTRELPRSVGQLTELVGRVPLKDIVGETTDLIEQLCIEAALELTRDNRASAAEMLGLSRQSLYVKLRRYGLGDLGSGTPAEAEK